MLLDNYLLINGDCVKEIKNIPNEYVHFQIFSPPFPQIYVYSDRVEDMGNCTSMDQFIEGFSFLTPELFRIQKPGRITCVHAQYLPKSKSNDGYIGFDNFIGDLIEEFMRVGFIHHGPPIVIWKDPVVEMQRTKALGLLNKQKDKDACMSRTGNPDFLLVFRKPGENPEPVRHSSTNSDDPNYIPISLWQKYASPVWYDIKQTNTLNKEGKESDDEKHIAPLQLDTIERAIHLWTNPNDIVFTPFLGIGSEVYQALKMGRRGIGIELKESYYRIAQRNCRNAVSENYQLSLL